MLKRVHLKLRHLHALACARILKTVNSATIGRREVHLKLRHCIDGVVSREY